MQAIVIIKKRVEKSEKNEKFIPHETATRYALVNPLLTALGWDVSDPDIVKPENSKPGYRVDYKMGSTMVVEAKKINDRLDQEKKMSRYMKGFRVWYGVLTDGATWKLYRTNAYLIPGIEETPMTLDLIHQGATFARDAERLSRKFLQCKDSPPRPAAKTGLRWRVEKTMPLGWHTQRQDLAKFSLEKAGKMGDMILPEVLNAPNRYISLNKSWNNIIIFVADWLVQNNKLSEIHCPVKADNGNVIFDKDELRRHGRLYEAQRVSRFYIDAGLKQEEVIPSAVKLIERAGDNPSRFTLDCKVGNDPQTVTPRPNSPTGHDSRAVTVPK